MCSHLIFWLCTLLLSVLVVTAQSQTTESRNSSLKVRFVGPVKNEALCGSQCSKDTNSHCAQHGECICNDGYGRADGTDICLPVVNCNTEHFREVQLESIRKMIQTDKQLLNSCRFLLGLTWGCVLGISLLVVCIKPTKKPEIKFNLPNNHMCKVPFKPNPNSNLAKANVNLKSEKQNEFEMKVINKVVTV